MRHGPPHTNTNITRQTNAWWWSQRKPSNTRVPHHTPAVLRNAIILFLALYANFAYIPHIEVWTSDDWWFAAAISRLTNSDPQLIDSLLDRLVVYAYWQHQHQLRRWLACSIVHAIIFGKAAFDRNNEHHNRIFSENYRNICDIMLRLVFVP